MVALRTAIAESETTALDRGRQPPNVRRRGSTSEASSSSSFSDSEASVPLRGLVSGAERSSSEDSESKSASGYNGESDGERTSAASPSPRAIPQLPTAMLLCAALCALAGAGTSDPMQVGEVEHPSIVGAASGAAAATLPRCSLSAPELRVLYDAIAMAGASLAQPVPAASPTLPMLCAEVASRAVSLLCAILEADASLADMAEPPPPVASLADLMSAASLVVVTSEARLQRLGDAASENATNPNGPGTALHALVMAVAAGCASATA